MSRTIRAAVAAMAAATCLTSCTAPDGYSVRDEQAAQQDIIGDTVHVAATFCLDPRRAGSCDAAAQPAGILPGVADDGGLQFFAAFLVPDTAAAPATATATLPAGLGTVTLRRRAGIDETLDLARPAPAGRRWVGYLSPLVGAARAFAGPADVARGLRRASEAPAPAAATAGDDWTAAADFVVARGPGGLPTPAEFEHAVVGGTRMAYPASIYDGIDPVGLDVGSGENWGLELLDTRPVDCRELRPFPYSVFFGASLDAAPRDGSGYALVPTTLCGTPSADGALALRDLRGSGGAVTAAPGTTVTVPFALRYAGDAGPTFALGATTAVPGATAAPSAPALTPAAAGFHDVGVVVAVPAGTAPGDYAVQLSATVGGQVRRAQGTLTVTPGAPAAAAQGAAATGQDGQGPVAGAGALSAGAGRLVEFHGFDRSGPGPNGTVNLGDVLCRKAQDACGFVTVQLTVRWDALHGGAATAAARRRVRMVTVGRAALWVPAQGRRRVEVALGPAVRALLRSGRVLPAVVAVRAAGNRLPIVHRVALRSG